MTPFIDSITPVLSIRQPWAWLIIHGGKDIENRSWPTKIRGRVLIHAAKGMSHTEYDLALDTAHRINPALQIPGYREIQRGGIIGEVILTDCVRTSTSPWFFGHCGFVLTEPQPIEFYPCRGALGFFTLQHNQPKTI